MAFLAAGVAAVAGIFEKPDTVKQTLINKFTDTIKKNIDLSANCQIASAATNRIAVDLTPPAYCGTCVHEDDPAPVEKTLPNGDTTYELPYQKDRGKVLMTKDGGDCVRYGGPDGGSITIENVTQKIDNETKISCRQTQQQKQKALTDIKDDLTQKLKRITQSFDFSAFERGKDSDQTTKNIKGIVDETAASLTDTCSLKALHTNYINAKQKSCAPVTVKNISQSVTAEAMAECVQKQLEHNASYQHVTNKISDSLEQIEKNTIAGILDALMGPMIIIGVIIALVIGSTLMGGGGGASQCSGFKAETARWLPTVLGAVVTVAAFLVLPGDKWPWQNWLYKWAFGFPLALATLGFASMAYFWDGCRDSSGGSFSMKMAKDFEADPELVAA